MQPDFSHVRVWIFDLDNTLYQAGSDLFAQIDARMQAFVGRRLGVDLAEARHIQKTYYREYGTTLTGLMRQHDVDPEDFLADVHNIDLSALKPDERLNTALAALPGKRFVFTNGCRSHAARILARAGLSDAFDGIWDIRTMVFSPKPLPAAYERVIAESGISPSEAAFFDDIARNLVPARAVGMTTIWVRNESEWSLQGPDFPVAGPENIDYETWDLATFLNTIRTEP